MKKLVSYEACQKWVKKNGIKSSVEYIKSQRPKGVPTTPQITYKNKGWTTWADFFGTELSGQKLNKNTPNKKFEQSQVNNFLRCLLKNADIEQIEHFVKNHRAGVKAAATKKAKAAVA